MKRKPRTKSKPKRVRANSLTSKLIITIKMIIENKHRREQENFTLVLIFLLI